MRAFAIGAVLALGMTAASPAIAQDTSGQMGTMGGNSSAMSSGSMTKSQMAAMKHCQGMSSDMMMKNKKCAAMAKMHPDMMQPNSTTSNN